MAEVVIVDSSDEGEENSHGLTSDECERRCQAFAEVTGTDTALAMFYLQDREWNVETSVNDYFQGQGQPSSGASSDPGQSSGSHSSTEAQAADTYLTTSPPVLQIQKENRIRVLSWNIDGLDPDNLQSRTQGVCSVLKQENPEVIFLQEVVQRSLVILESSLTSYQFHMGYDDPALLPFGAYFTAMLLRKDCVITDSVRLADFPRSKMERNLLAVQCRIKSIPVTLMTSHLESTAEYSNERKNQLKIAFDQMQKSSEGMTTIFGGDLNLRDKELSGISAKPPGVYDIWECTGKRPEAQFTWDLRINDNKQMHGRYQPRCRFDRMYVSHPKRRDDKGHREGDGDDFQGDEVTAKVKARLKPVYFELVGIQRLASCRRFPSDHWGILTHFDILD